MTLTFRRDLGGPLSAAQFDGNTDDLNGRVTALEDNPPEAISVTGASLAGTQLTFIRSDLSTLPPITLPLRRYNPVVYTAGNSAAVDDVFPLNGSLWLVITAHTMAAEFDAGANDGAGHNFYFELLPNPGNSLPDGGLRHQKLRKASNSNYATEWGFDDALEVTFEASSSSDLTSTNVADTLEELEAKIATAVAAVAFDATEIAFDPSSASGLSSTHVAAALDELATRTVDFSELAGTISPAQSRPTTVPALGASGTVSLDPDLGDVFSITPAGAVTINAASAPASAKITIIVTTSGASSYLITLGANFKSTGSLATGTATAKTFALTFVGDGSNLVETARTVAM
ncbi:hypothetical protein [Bradyrhizobium sp. RDM4]|uniref:hypothetical protein n=1 Tax=Bradyrhizobium sp. RDM4 TaxID=3378765 RepID=UPI0038FBFC72